MRDLRILFMGTPDFAVESLKQILESGFKVIGVITAPDKPAGRGRKVQESAVKKYALEKDLKILQPTNLKSQAFLQELKTLNPNVQVVVAFRMLPKEVWALPEFGTFNLHASLLPQYRGAAPINWAIINAEPKTGVSTFFINEKIDTGAMLLQEEVKINPEENVGQLHDKLMKTGANLVVETLKLIRENRVKSTPQDESLDLKDAPKLTNENTKINWNRSIDEIYNHIRGLNPYPAAWSILENDAQKLRVKIYEVRKINKEHQEPAGSITVRDKKLHIAAPGGFLLVDSMQLPGKRKMNIKELLNGFAFTPTAKFR